MTRVTSPPTLAVTHARTLIANDHRLFVSGLERLLTPDYDIVSAIHDLQLLLDAARRLWFAKSPSTSFRTAWRLAIVTVMQATDFRRHDARAEL